MAGFVDEGNPRVEPHAGVHYLVTDGLVTFEVATREELLKAHRMLSEGGREVRVYLAEPLVVSGDLLQRVPRPAQ